MPDTRVYRFEMGGWVIACLATGCNDAKSYIKRLYGGRAKYVGRWHGAPGMACGHITPSREEQIRERNSQ